MNIVVPQLGESVIEARVGRWLKKAGDAVAQGDPLVERETDKIDLEVNAESAGVLARIDHQDGADVKVGDVLGVIEEGAAAPASAPTSAADAATAGKPGTPAPSTAPGTGHPAPSTAPGTGHPAPGTVTPDVKATATARKVAQDLGVDLANVKGSGEGGRVTKDDVQKAVTPAPAAPAAAPVAKAPASVPPTPTAAPGTAAPGTAPTSAADAATAGKPGTVHGAPGTTRVEERVRMSKRRATIAKRLVEAQHTAAMLTTFNEVDMTAVQALRARRKEAFQKRHGVNLGLSSFFVKAAVGALKAFPRINAEIQGDEMVLKRYYDVGIAVGASSGLVVPVLRDADRMSFWDIEAGIKDFAKRAEEGTLSLDEIKGGTFTITNGGVFGSLLSTPILNPPQVGILGLHKIEERPVAVDGQVVIRPMMYVALSYDHRIVDGLEAVQFLVKVKEFIEDPGHLLIEG